jgi:glycosyltransferase involved in cell wall biosynthesis
MSSTTRRVLVVTQAFEGHLTGWGKHTSKLLRAIDGAQEDIRLSLLTSYGEVKEEAPSAVSKVITTPVRYGERVIQKALSGLCILLYVLAYRHRWDVVYCSNFYFPVPLIVHFVNAIGGQVIVRIAGQETTASGWRGALRDSASRRTDDIVVLNSAVQKYLVDLGVSKQVIHRIPNAVDITTYAPARKPSVPEEAVLKPSDREASDQLEDVQEYVSSSDPVRHLLCVAAVCKRKGIHHVVEAMEQVCDQNANAKKLYLTVVGPFNEAESNYQYTDRLVDLVRESGLEDAVTFTGRVKGGAPYYREADAFLLPSYEEGMPNVLLEAMASALPCIATAIPGVKDVVSDGETALLVRPRSSKDIADALHQLCTDEVLAARLGWKARSLIEAEYSLDKMVERYRTLLGG